MYSVYQLVVIHNRTRYRIRVEQLPADESFEYYRITGRNRSVVYKNNRPVLQRHNLKHRKPTWKIHEGNIWNAAFELKLLEEIEKKVIK